MRNWLTNRPRPITSQLSSLVSAMEALMPENLCLPAFFQISCHQFEPAPIAWVKDTPFLGRQIFQILTHQMWISA